MPAQSTLPPSLIPFVLQKVGGGMVDPGGSPRLKTTGALSTLHSVVNNNLFDFSVWTLHPQVRKTMRDCAVLGVESVL